MEANLDTIVSKISEAIQNEASVRAVFGAPLKLDQHTIIPVAVVSVTLGGGGGSGHGEVCEQGKAPRLGNGFGAGGGADMRATPIGFIHEANGTVQFTAIETAHSKNDFGGT